MWKYPVYPEENRLVLPKLSATKTRTTKEDEEKMDDGTMSIGSSYSSKFRSTSPRRLTRVSSNSINNYQQLISNTRPLIGGTPIRYEEAALLKKLLFGSLLFSFGRAWRSAIISFKEGTNGCHPYGLLANRDGTRGLILCIQAFLLKNLLFTRSTNVNENYSELLRCSEHQRKDCLVEALCDLFWQAGSSKRATIVLPSSNDYIHSTGDYKADGITEKLHIFDFQSKNEMKRFLRRHFAYVETPNNYGCIIILYSVIFSRTLSALQGDLLFNNAVHETLLQTNESLTQSGINLLLTGKACRFIHNGAILYDEEGELLVTPKVGVASRSVIGYLHWDKSWLDEDKSADQDPDINRVGSMLKTPKYPIWITRVNNQLGLLFCTNPELVSNWKSEHRFVLHYYMALTSQNRECKLTLDTFRPRTARIRRTKQAELEEQKRIPPLEQCVLTKWYGAHVVWNCIPTY